VSAFGYYARITPEELDEARKNPEFEQELEATLFDTDDHETWFLDKAWDGVRYLLNMTGAPIDVHGGTPISDFEWSNDGPARCLTPDQVKEMSAYFQATPPEHLASHYDPAAMTAADIYPSIWDREDDAEGNLRWLQNEYEGLAGFFAAAAGAGDAIITMIG
jgi:hypothetical protein